MGLTRHRRSPRPTAHQAVIDELVRAGHETQRFRVAVAAAVAGVGRSYVDRPCRCGVELCKRCALRAELECVPALVPDAYRIDAVARALRVVEVQSTRLVTSEKLELYADLAFFLTDEEWRVDLLLLDGNGAVQETRTGTDLLRLWWRILGRASGERQAG